MFTGCNKVDSIKCFEDQEFHFMKECTACLRSLIVAFGTLRCPLKLPSEIMSMLTDESTGSFELSQMIITGLIIWELLMKFKKGQALVSFTHNFVFETKHKILNISIIDLITLTFIRSLFQYLV